MGQITPRPTATTLSAPESSVDRGERRRAGRELCDVVEEIHGRGWAPGTGGNMSVVLRREPLRLLITRSGRHKRRLHPEADLVLVGDDGQPTAGAAGRPSAETLLHAALARAAGAAAVLHTHSIAATLLSEHFLPRGSFVLRDCEMLKGIDGVGSHEEEVEVPILANSQDMAELAAAVEKLVRERPGLRGFLLAGHGLYAWGADLDAALRHVEVYEFLFEYVARRTPFAPYEG